MWELSRLLTGESVNTFFRFLEKTALGQESGRPVIIISGFLRYYHRKHQCHYRSSRSQDIRIP